jgi:threonine dehydrogenase-like Zn-dependent dehydrogenase
MVSDLDPERLRVAEALGAERTVAAGDSPADVLASAGLVPDVIFEVSGAAPALELAIALAPRGGRVVAVGVQKTAPAIDMRRVTLDELELNGTVAHVARDDFPEALRLIALRQEGWTDVAPEVLPLDLLVDEGIRPMVEGTSRPIKVLIDPSGDRRRPSETSSSAVSTP